MPVHRLESLEAGKASCICDRPVSMLTVSVHMTPATAKLNINKHQVYAQQEAMNRQVLVSVGADLIRFALEWKLCASV